MSRLLRALGVTEGTKTAWKLFLGLQVVFFITILYSVTRLVLNGTITLSTSDFSIGIIVELMGASASFFVLFLYWELPRIKAQEKSEQQTQKSLEEIKTMLASQQPSPLPPVTIPASVITSSTPLTLSRNTILLLSTLLSAILIIFLRRTHKP